MLKFGNHKFFSEDEQGENKEKDIGGSHRNTARIKPHKFRVMVLNRWNLVKFDTLGHLNIER